MTKQQIIYKNVSDLIPYARNSRTHSDEQVLQIAASIKEFGFTNPILIDGENGIIAGHGRVLAAIKLSINEVPCIELSGMTDTQKRAYIIADNKLALNAGWDGELLKVEFEELEHAGYDLGIIGFSNQDISALYGHVDDQTGGDAGGIDYAEKFAVLVECLGEHDQSDTYEKLTQMGYTCRVLVN